MKTIKLKQAPIHFDVEHHKYYHTETHEELTGITHLIKQKVCPDEYRGISQQTLDAAAQRGHQIHSIIELCDTMGVESPAPEYTNYCHIKQTGGFRTIENEYLVTDNKQYASCIDLVWADQNDKIILADIKTTSTLNREYVSWQLSTYAYLFELCNPRKKVDRIYAVWLRGEKYELAELPRKTKEQVMQLLYDDDFRATPEIPSWITDVQQQYIDNERQIHALQAQQAALKETLLSHMKEAKLKSCDTGSILVTLRKATTRTTFDSTRFKAEHADLYGQYLKEATSPESITIKVRDQ